MKEYEKLPTQLLHSADTLKALIMNNPDLPLVVFAGIDANNGDYSYMSCSSCRANVGEFLDCMQDINDEICFTDRDEFREELEYLYSDFDGSESEFEQLIDNALDEYEPYWKPCIIIHVDN